MFSATAAALWLVVCALAVFFVKENYLDSDHIKSLSILTTGIGLFVGAGWAVVTYFNNKRLEFQSYFIERQVEIAILTANTVGNLVGCSEKEWDETKGRFWELYWGRLVLFEDAGVIEAMIALGTKLNATPFGRQKELTDEVYDVSLELRRFLEEKSDNYWGLPFEKAPDQTKVKKEDI